jgi:hypothetical protein
MRRKTNRGSRGIKEMCQSADQITYLIILYECEKEAAKD